MEGRTIVLWSSPVILDSPAVLESCCAEASIGTIDGILDFVRDHQSETGFPGYVDFRADPSRIIIRDFLEILESARAMEGIEEGILPQPKWDTL